MRQEETLHGHRIIAFSADSQFNELVIIRPPNSDRCHVWTIVELAHHLRLARQWVEIVEAAQKMATEPTT